MSAFFWTMVLRFSMDDAVSSSDAACSVVEDDSSSAVDAI